MPAITLVLHNIRSTHNVGSIFRSAEGFGVSKIILSGYTPYPKKPDDSRLPHIAEKLTKQINKTALGAELMVPFEQFDSLDTWLKQSNMPLYALEQSPTAINLREAQTAPSFALLLGEEVDGIDNFYLSQCEKTFEISMRGNKESFNVSVAAAVALYAFSQ